MADGEVGSVPEIQWFPFNTPFVDFINEQVITPTNTNFDESYRRILGSNTIVLRSKLPRGYYETEPLSITHPSLYFIDTFKRFLENEGITISGRLITDRQNRNWEQESDFTLLDTHTSVPLREIISRMNKESDNFYAEMLLKTIAAEHYNVEGSTELGIQLVKQFLDRNGIDGSKTEIRDASGMAPATLLRTMDLNQLLSRIKTYSWYNDFYNSLSIAGNDGTLRYRFRQSPVVNRFNGKSGYMSGVRAINGYLATSSGQELIVTIATNNYTVRTVTVDHLHERILEVLYNLY